MARVEDLARFYLDYRYWLLKLSCVTPFVLLGLPAGMIISGDPSFSIKTFHVPALNKFINQTTASDADSLIFFDLELHNEMEYKGLRYGPVNLTFSYAAGNTSIAIGTYTISGFYQGKGKTAQRRDVAVATGSVRWREAAMSALSGGSTADFSVDLFTKVRFNNYLFYSWEERVVARGKVKVDDSGRKAGEKPAELDNPGAMSKRLVAIFTIIGLFVAYGFLIWFFLWACGHAIYRKNCTFDPTVCTFGFMIFQFDTFGPTVCLFCALLVFRPKLNGNAPSASVCACDF